MTAHHRAAGATLDTAGPRSKRATHWSRNTWKRIWRNKCGHALEENGRWQDVLSRISYQGWGL